MGTRSHLGDLEMITPALADFFSAHGDAHLVTFLGKHAPKALKGFRNITHRPTLKWPAFRRFMADSAWHAALAPMRETPVNRARSFNKLLDHASVGAVGLYSAAACPAIARAVRHGMHGLHVKAHAHDWLDALEYLYHNREHARKMAQKGAEQARVLGNPERCRQFWMKELSIS